LFKEAERTAKRLKVSRSELYRRALESFLVTLRAPEVTASYDDAFAEPDSSEEVAFRRRAARQGLRAVEWQEK
jgi:hypothetical protein